MEKQFSICDQRAAYARQHYPPGTRIRLLNMDDPFAPVRPGTCGRVECVDDAGQLHMKWDNGRSLAVIPGEDSFEVLSRPVKQKSKGGDVR